jgi:acetylserotonin O-methyltransferase
LVSVVVSGKKHILNPDSTRHPDVHCRNNIMSNADAAPDPKVVLDLMEAFRRSKTMFAAVSLGVFDALAEGPKTASSLATELKTNADALGRLLDACVGLALIEHGANGYSNSPAAAAYLCRNSTRRLTGYLFYSNEVLWKLWANLEDAVREGTHRWQQTYGWDGPIFSHFFRTEEAKREFLLGMHGYGLISSPQVVAAFDLSRFRRLVDLGGATGHLAVAACQHHPTMTAVVFDLPDAVPLAQEMIQATPAAGKVSVQAGNFFTDPLPQGDLYAVGRILHDWSEDKILLLLGKIREQLPTGGALLIAEKLLSADRAGPVWAQMQSLNMLVCTEGKERTLEEYQVLLKQAGFEEVHGRQTASPLDVVLAIK